MDKDKVIALLGGSISATAKELGVSYQAVRKWRNPLTDPVAQRVVTFLLKRNVPWHVIKGLDA